MSKTLISIYVLWNLFCITSERGLLLLYRPRDISQDCATSQHLRYDLSFGMGMSDTITLVFRTLHGVDYECGVEIVTESSKSDVYLLVVIRYPTSIGFNCMFNPDAFTVLKKEDCLRICDQVGGRDVYSPFFVVSVAGRLRFRFLSNSSLNAEMNADLYEVTATSARKKGKRPCNLINETICILGEENYCFTSGVVCDGIKNCGVSDWFDERKSDCELPEQRLGFSPVIAVGAALLCATVAAIHGLLQCLPSSANSFFIFNANEDNRLCIDPVFKCPISNDGDTEKTNRVSLIPVQYSSSSEDVSEDHKPQVAENLRGLNVLGFFSRNSEVQEENPRTTVMCVKARIQERLRSVAGRGKASKSDYTTKPSSSFDV